MSTWSIEKEVAEAGGRADLPLAAQLGGQHTGMAVVAPLGQAAPGPCASCQSRPSGSEGCREPPQNRQGRSPAGAVSDRIVPGR